MILKIDGEQLLSLFLCEMNRSDNFHFISGLQPFKIQFKSKDYFVYIKTISSAYFKTRPDVNRAQLPLREDFNYIKKSNIPFIFLGYDPTYDVYVCWNYHIVKRRLNVQANVSFYSRQSWLGQVQEETFLRKQLKNGEDTILFKRKNIVSFFNQINSFFEEKTNEVKNEMEDKENLPSELKVYKITDPVLLNKLRPLLTGSILHTLEAIQVVQDFYGDKYPNMTYRDWSNLVKGLSF